MGTGPLTSAGYNAYIDVSWLHPQYKQTKIGQSNGQSNPAEGKKQEA